MGKYYFMLVFFFCSLMGYAQDIVYPVLPEEASTFKEFVPSGWDVMDSDVGDLNKDGYPDIVFVITNTNNKITIAGEDSADFVTYPRILGIALWDHVQKKYKLNVQSNTFIISAEDSFMDEPFVGINIEKGTLKADFHYWYSMGSWFASNEHFTFRYQNAQFELIGFDEDSTHRASHDESYLSVNYSTQRAETMTIVGDTQNSEKGSGTFEVSRLYTFETLKSPADFEAPQIIYK